MMPSKLPIEPAPLSRRRFLASAAAAGAGLTISFRLPAASSSASESVPTPNEVVDAYVHIAPDDTVTVKCAHMDMGQGCYHGVASLVAEELDAGWAQLRVIGAAGNAKAYGNVAWGGAIQGTGGSSAMVSSYQRYRKAGAMARAMLVSAAARRFDVPAAEIGVSDGVVSHPSGQRATFGELADAAARETAPAEVSLKQPAQFKVIGSESFRRLDSAAKATGREQFTLDVQLPGMLSAVVAHPPVFGATVRSFDPARALSVDGVTEVVRISRGVAVVAHNTWAAMKGRDALVVDWDESTGETRGSEQLVEEYVRRSQQPGDAIAADRGDTDRALAGASRTIEATYRFPFLAHAAMEPLDVVVRRNGDELEIWGGHQMPDLYQHVGATIAGVAKDRVRMHVMKTGGGFGRRAVTDADVIVEAVETAKAIDWRAPVKLIWTREDDMRGGRYRPMYVHAVKIGLDAQGRISGWRHRLVGQSILSGTPFEPTMVKDGVDATTVEGVANTAYAIVDFRTEVTNTEVGVPVLWWRSVGHTHTAYVMETLIDEVATEAGKDPVALRRELLSGHPRHLAALDLAAEKAGWSEPPAAGRFRGIAVHESFSTVVAEVAEISLRERGFKVERVVCAVNCGVAINPDVVRAQMEGSIGYGLSAALHEELTLTSGRVDQGNYDTYTPLRIGEMPDVEVHIVPSTASPTGVGEPGVPPIGPAVANAVAAATGRRVRTLPFDKGMQG